MFDTIAAISSGLVNQPISIIRLSGSNSFNIINQIFSKEVNVPNQIVLGYILQNKNKINQIKLDEVLITIFKAPHSFTGEDMVEIYAHGGIFNTQRILKLLFAYGARQANRGEFSLRAVLNNKIDLIKAEAIHDLIFANTEEQANLSVKKFDGQTSILIDNLIKKLEQIIGICWVNIDYPEYDDVEQLNEPKIISILKKLIKEVNLIIESSKMSRVIFEGLNVAIIGQPNSGKSSLLNALLNEEKAIVSEIAGTTRDVVEGKIQIGQVLLNLKDTAGIHTTYNFLEKQGIDKALQQIQQSDLIIYLVEAKNRFQKDLQILDFLKDKKFIKVISKSDLISDKKDHEIYISTKNNDLKSLIGKLNQLIPKIDVNSNYIVNNTRQLSLIEATKIHLTSALSSIEKGSTVDMILFDLQSAWEKLASVLGKKNDETLLDKMFQSFCLGK